MKSAILTEREIRRFSQQIQLPQVGLEGQEKIRKASVLVIGAGGKGTSVMRCMVSAGLGTLGICDNFIVEETCFPKHALYNEKDLGKQKAIIARQRLLESGSGCTIEVHNICLAETNILGIIEPYDLLVDATDNFPIRYLINDAAVRVKKPVVYGSVVHNTCLISVFNLSGGPSFRCLYPNQPKNIQKKYTDDGLPAVGLLYQIAGSLMATEALKVILGIPSILNGKLLSFHLDTMDSTFESITRQEENFRSDRFA
jgi:adenylyltransferase/sulfurtransferase